MLRDNYLIYIEKIFKTMPIIAMLGPRQCGKTTLARRYFEQNQGERVAYFDLENPLDLLRLEDPLLALGDLEGLVVIDEIQRRPDLFPVLADQRDKPQRRFLILGSASRELIRQSSESLAGRIHYMELTPFSLEETQDLKKTWLRGGFPHSYLAETDAESLQWRQDYARTFLEQDIPNLGIHIPPQNLRRFWMMLAHYHGQIFNASELGNALDLSSVTIKKYLDILTGTFMVRQLQPWWENIAKRQVKTPKIYFRDSGLLHLWLNIPDESALSLHPKVGASWEGFALESVLRHLRLGPDQAYFWSVHHQAELDLLVMQGRTRIGFEFKYSKAPSFTRSMKMAAEVLKLDRLIVIYAGDLAFKLAPQVECLPLQVYLNDA